VQRKHKQIVTGDFIFLLLENHKNCINITKFTVKWKRNEKIHNSLCLQWSKNVIKTLTEKQKMVQKQKSCCVCLNIFVYISLPNMYILLKTLIYSTLQKLQQKQSCLYFPNI